MNHLPKRPRQGGSDEGLLKVIMDQIRKYLRVIVVKTTFSSETIISNLPHKSASFEVTKNIAHLH